MFLQVIIIIIIFIIRKRARRSFDTLFSMKWYFSFPKRFVIWIRVWCLLLLIFNNILRGFKKTSYIFKNSIVWTYVSSIFDCSSFYDSVAPIGFSKFIPSIVRVGTCFFTKHLGGDNTYALFLKKCIPFSNYSFNYFWSSWVFLIVLKKPWFFS